MTNSVDRSEARAGLTIAVFAALLAINDLMGGKFGDDEILGANKRANEFAWYQAKSTKQALVQSHLELARILPVAPDPAAAAPPPTEQAPTEQPPAAPALAATAPADQAASPPEAASAEAAAPGAAAGEAARAALLAKWEAEVERYAKEKKEILLGSAAVGPEGWVNEDEDGNKGTIEGAAHWKTRLAELEEAGDQFDLGSLFLQLTLVLGAVSLVVQEPRLRSRYYWSMVLLGVVGCGFGAYGLVLAAL